MERPELDDLLDAIYEAAAEPDLWVRALEKIGDRFGGAPIVMGLQPAAGKPLLIAQARLDDGLLRVFRDRYTTPATNPSIPYYFTQPAGIPFDFVGIYGASRFKRTDIYKDMYARQGIE